MEISDDQIAIDAWIQAFNISHIKDKGFRKLSTGESRKVILIRALLQDSNTLVFDEPFDGLDANSQVHLKQTLNELHQKG